MTKASRLLQLMDMIQEKNKFTVEELAIECGVSYRTMLRYLQELSQLGMPLYSEVGKNGGYSLLRTNKQAARQPLARAVSQESEGVALSQPSLKGEQAQTTEQKSSKAGKIVIKPECRVVGLELRTPYTAIRMAQALVPRMWKELKKRLQEIAGCADHPNLIGVMQNRNQEYVYYAGVEVADLRRVPTGMKGIVLPTQQYAVYTHSGRWDRVQIDQTYFYALELLERDGYQADLEAYCLEMYQEPKHLEHLELPPNQQERQIYVPIR